MTVASRLDPVVRLFANMLSAADHVELGRAPDRVSFKWIRDLLICMSGDLGTISSMFNGVRHDDAPYRCFLFSLVRISTALSLNIHDAIQSKLELNRQKYPLHLCRGKPAATKYTEYSKDTGITKRTGQSILLHPVGKEAGIRFLCHHEVDNTDFIRNLPTLERILLDFVSAREWEDDDTPRNLLIATIGEFGELSQLFAWRGDEGCATFADDTIDKIAQEIADVAILFVRLAFRLRVDFTNSP